MLHDDYILFRLYVPLVLTVLLVIMAYVHRKQLFRYIYFGNIFCFVIAVVSYVLVMNHPAGQPYSAPWMAAVPFLWLFGIFGGYFLFLVSAFAFLVEMAQRKMLARVLLGIGILFFVLLLIKALFILFGAIWVMRGVY